MSTAEKFKALGAGNGLTFPKAKAPTETRNKPLTVLTQKECMAWYWLLEDIDLTLTLVNNYEGDVYQSSLHLQFDIISGHDQPIRDDGGAGGARFYDGAPKDRANLHPKEQLAMADGKFSHDNIAEEIATPQTGGVGPVNDGGLGLFNLHMMVEWFDDDTAAVVILVDDGYHRFVLTNLPATSDLFTGSNFFGHNTNHTLSDETPNSLGTISTDYGDLTAYDVSHVPANEVTAINGTVQFYDFGS